MFYVKGLQQQHGIKDANLKAMLEPHCSRMLSRVFGASCNFHAHGTQIQVEEGPTAPVLYDQGSLATLYHTKV